MRQENSGIWRPSARANRGARLSSWRAIALVAFIGAVLAAGCSSDNESVDQGDLSVDEARAALKRQKLPSSIDLPPVSSLKDRGNTGEKPTWYTDVQLTDEQIRELQKGDLKAAFLNWSEGAYNEAVLAGARDALSALGIDLVAVTNYNFDQAQLQEDVRSVLPREPDIIFYSGVDPTADRAALQPAVDAGVSIVSYANAPGEWTTGDPDSFVTLISYPTFQMGEVVADVVKDRFKDGADLGMIYYDANYKLVNEREDGFQDALKGSNVRVVTRQPMSDPADTQEITSAMIARDPNLNVVFAPWDLPAEGVVAALNADNSAAEVANIDLGVAGARSIACGGRIFVESAQLVYEWGRTGAIAAALHELGEPVPPYIVVPVFAVTKENVEEGWDLAFGGRVPLPPEAKSCIDGA